MIIKTKKLTLKELKKYLKTYSFIIQHAEIYGGLSSTYDFGPLGTFLKRQIKNLWFDFFITNNELVHEIDSNILTHEKILKASEHIKTFQNQYIIRCQICNKTKEYPSDEINNLKTIKDIKLFCNCSKIICKKCKFSNNIVEYKLLYEFDSKKIKRFFIKCSKCSNELNWILFNTFNLLFKTEKGNSLNNKEFVYLRPETAQGIFTNVSQIARSLKLKLPFGLAQIGKSFRNEITTEKSIFRTIEFEQMEIEFFHENIKPKDSMYWFENFVKKINEFLEFKLEINKKNIRENRKTKKIAHYSDITSDFEYNFPFGWEEIWGLSNRGTFDLTQHKNFSNSNIGLFNSKGKIIIPHVVEPSVGIERLMLVILFEKLFHETLNGKERLVLKLNNNFCYYNIAILPLTNKLNNKAQEIFNDLKKNTNLRIVLDTKKSIGKRYMFHDAIGTNECITIDFETKNDNCITIRNRDTMKQKRIPIENLKNYLNKK